MVPRPGARRGGGGRLNRDHESLRVTRRTKMVRPGAKPSIVSYRTLCSASMGTKTRRTQSGSGVVESKWRETSFTFPLERRHIYRLLHKFSFHTTMKCFIAIIALCSSLLITTEAATCSFCEGIDFDQSLEIPYTDGMTCGMVTDTLAILAFEEGTEDCSSLQGAQAICCPEALLSDRTGGPCGFCAGVDVLVDVNPEIPAEDAGLAGMNCGIIAVFAETGVNGTATECAELRFMEGVCCPEAFLSDRTGGSCGFCAGVDVLVDVKPKIPAEWAEMAGTVVNCGTIAVFAEIGNVTTSECAELRLMEGTCCPGARSSSGTSPRYVQYVYAYFLSCMASSRCLFALNL
jgi:hypothetical protein